MVCRDQSSEGSVSLGGGAKNMQISKLGRKSESSR
jgi:hypothetical protein